MRLLACSLVLLSAAVASAAPGSVEQVYCYLSDPAAAWAGTSDCQPCNLFCAELRARNATLVSWGYRPWLIGYTGRRPDGQTNRIVLLQAEADKPRPYFVRVVNGVKIEADVIVGYDESDPRKDLNAIRALAGGRRVAPPQPPVVGPPQPTPQPTPTPTPPQPQPPAPQPGPVDPDVEAFGSTFPVSYRAQWTWPMGESLKQHLMREHGWPRSYVDSLSPDQLKALHDRDHNSGRVTPYGQQRWAAPATTMRARGAVVVSAPAPQVVYAAPPTVVYETRATTPIVYAAPPAPVYAAAPYRASSGGYRSSTTWRGPFGVPLWGQTRSYSGGGYSACPGGICPR